MTKQERDKLRDLALAATPGEWAVNSDDDLDIGDDRVYIGDVENAAYIAAANPATLLALLDRVDELEARESTPASAAPNPRELWEEAQLWPGEEIEDGVARVKALLSAYYSAPGAGGGE